MRSRRFMIGLMAGILLSSSADGQEISREVNALMQTLQSPDASRRTKEESLARLRRLGSDAEPALDIVTAYASSPSQPVTVRQAAIRTLGAIGKPGLPTLLKTLAEADTKIRGASIDALRAMGPSASDAIPVLVKWVERGDREQCRLALVALEKIGPKPDEFVPVAVTVIRRATEIRSLSSEAVDRSVHAVTAMRILSRMDPLPKEIVPVLVSVLKLEKKQVPRQDNLIREAMAVLGQIGPDAAEAVPTLRSMLDDRNWGRDAEKALAKINVKKPVK